MKGQGFCALGLYITVAVVGVNVQGLFHAGFGFRVVGLWCLGFRSRASGLVPGCLKWLLVVCVTMILLVYLFM